MYKKSQVNLFDVIVRVSRVANILRAGGGEARRQRTELQQESSLRLKIKEYSAGQAGDLL
jgi:hypothetical protein